MVAHTTQHWHGFGAALVIKRQGKARSLMSEGVESYVDTHRIMRFSFRRSFRRIDAHKRYATDSALVADHVRATTTDILETLELVIDDGDDVMQRQGSDKPVVCTCSKQRRSLGRLVAKLHVIVTLRAFRLISGLQLPSIAAAARAYPSTVANSLTGHHVSLW